MGAHPDDLASQPGAKDPFAIFEAKTRSPFLRSLWGDEGSDQVPDAEMCQVQWYMHLTGYSVAYIAALFDRMLSIFRIAKDAEFGWIAEEAAKKFWRDYVETGVPPPLRGIHVDDYIRKRFPKALLPLREPTREERELVAQIQEATAMEKASKLAKAEARANLKLLVGAAEGLKAADLTVYFRERAGRRKVDTAAFVVAMKNEIALQIGPRSPKKAALLIDSIDRALAQFTTTGEPYRDLRIYTPKGELE